MSIPSMNSNFDYFQTASGADRPDIILKSESVNEFKYYLSI